MQLADDIRKAKMGAHFMIGKHGKSQPSQPLPVTSRIKADNQPNLRNKRPLCQSWVQHQNKYCPCQILHIICNLITIRVTLMGGSILGDFLRLDPVAGMVVFCMILKAGPETSLKEPTILLSGATEDDRDCLNRNNFSSLHRDIAKAIIVSLKSPQQQLIVCEPTMDEELLRSQMLSHTQIEQFEGLVATQSSLTAGNPVSLEMVTESPKSEATQPLKLLRASADDSRKKTIGETRERRKAILLDSPDQNPAGRRSKIARSAALRQSRPLSTDDILKERLSAELRGRRPQPRPVKEGKDWKKVLIKWKTPPEIRIPEDWRVAIGDNSTEIEIQESRIRREKETIYSTKQEIPSNPKEPRDPDMEYDTSSIRVIPTELLVDNESEETESPTPQPEPTSATSAPLNVPNHENIAVPDLKLLSESLKHSELFSAFGRLSGDENVKLLNTIKTNGVAAALGLLKEGSIGRRSEEIVAVSLPSSTPPSSSVMSQNWRTDVGYYPLPTTAQQSDGASRYMMSQQQQATQQYWMALAPAQMPLMHSSHVPNLPPAWAQNWRTDVGYNLSSTMARQPEGTPQYTMSQQQQPTSQYWMHTSNVPSLPPAWAQNSNVNPLQFSGTNVAPGWHFTPPAPPQSWNQNYRPVYDQRTRRYNSSGFQYFSGPGGSN